MAALVLVDDHILLRNALASHLSELGHTILFEANNGEEFHQKLKTHPLPEIVLMDIQMPVMDGYQATLLLKQLYPAIKVIALSMYENEAAIIRMLRNGAKGYILKDCEPLELNHAIQSVLKKGYYQSELITGKLIQTINDLDDKNDSIIAATNISQREQEFLKLAASEMTYKEIADKMKVGIRTVDGYRESLFQKLSVKSRVGLVLYAIRNRIVAV
jgi:two-component system, NarL family, invasion response regulator UvrY